VVKKLKRAFWLMKNGLDDHFETEISAAVVSQVRPNRSKLITSVIWTQQPWGQKLKRVFWPIKYALVGQRVCKISVEVDAFCDQLSRNPGLAQGNSASCGVKQRKRGLV